MKVDLEDFRRQYANLNDEALLDIDREELTPLAQQVYDAEVSSRGLDRPEEDAEENAPAAPKSLEDLVEVAVFDNPAEANVAKAILRLAEIPCALSTDLGPSGSVFSTLSDVKLFVPAGYEEQANEALNSEISEEELAAQAEAAAAEEEAAGEEEAGHEE